MTVIIHGGAFVGPTIASIRAAERITQTELGQRTGVAASQISKYEGSLVNPDVDTTTRLLAGLDHHLCAVPRIDATTARQRQAVIATATALANPQPLTTWADYIPALTDAVTMLQAADPFTETGNVYTDVTTLTGQLADARAEIARLRTLIRTTYDHIAPEATR